MKTLKNTLLIVIIPALLLPVSCQRSGESGIDKTADKTASLVQYESNGYLNKTVVPKLKREYKLMKAVSAYEYGLPILGIYTWYKGYLTETNELGNWIILNNRESKLPLMTANNTTPYVYSYIDLSEGPYYIVIPNFPTGGLINDIYQRPVTDLGVLGPDKGKGGKYLIVGPGQEIPEDNDADFIVRSKSNLNLIATRIFGNLKGDKFEQAVKSHKIYKYGEESGEPQFIYGKKNPGWWTTTPHGMKYWELLNEALQNEPVVERNRVIFTQLRPLGFEKGKPFDPTPAQEEILTEAAKTGEAMYSALTFSKPDEYKYWPDRYWYLSMNMKHLDQYAPSWWEVLEIGNYAFEAITTSKGMIMNNVGKGQKYLEAFTDENDNWLDGSNLYELVLPPNVPVNQFWSLTVYDIDTRCMINNPQQKSDVDSYRDLKVEEDGSIKLYVGPQAPAGYENNWVPSVPGKGFFVLFRLYGPEQPFYDKVWKLNDFKLIK